MKRSYSQFASSSSSSTPRNNYDVFLSFRGDTRNTFTSHLYEDERNESKFLKDFIKDVSSELGVASSKVSKDLVGMDSRLKEFKQCVSSSPEDVRFIGICGMGGLGKTTLARAYFDDMSSQFEASSFLGNVREVCKDDRGLEKLQNQLRTDIWKQKRSVFNKKVLVILDDVEKLNQLEGLAEKIKWFGDGSRIILTTRDEGLLTRAYGEEEYIIHKVDKLKDSEALLLFASKAFKTDFPPEDYRELSEKVIKYADGLPLALVVVGSVLRGKNIDQWKSALDRLKEYPEKEIMSVLRISFDGLEETEQKVFLDIACFFNGYDKDYIMKIMDCCDFFPEKSIKSLVDKSLLYMELGNRLRMHDLLEEMGKEIVREESSNEPGRQSRIWLWNDFDDVMSNDTGTEKVEAIVLRLWMPLENLNMRGFSKMKKLRLLVVYCHSDCQDLHLSTELRFLQWSGFPLSNIKQLWNNPTKPLYKLKSIDLTSSKFFKKLEVDFSFFPNLETLNLRFCDALEEFPCPATGFNRPSKLRSLDLSFCSSLTSLGPELPDSLESVNVNNCGRLHTFDPCNLRCSTILCVGCIKLVNRQGSKRTAITSLGRYLQISPSPSKRFDIVLPGDEIPSWFTHQVRGSSSIGLPLHSNWCSNNWMGFALSVCFSDTEMVLWEIEINEEDWGFGPVCSLAPYGESRNHVWILYLPRDNYFHSDWHKSGHIQFSFKCDGDDPVYNSDIQCGVRLVYEKDIEELNLHIEELNLTATHEPIGANMFEDKREELNLTAAHEPIGANMFEDKVVSSELASSSSSTPQNNYDVFLSFRGDTRNTFTSHLNKALRQIGIHTFLDEVELDRGKFISPGLEKAIEGSRCLVVILSPLYPESSWCMDELVKILQCMKMKDFETKQTVLPIFYHVNPDHIKKREGSFWDAFKSLEQEFRHDVQKVKSWRNALIDVVNVAGYSVEVDRTNEAKFIEDFIKEVSRKIGVASSKVSKDLVEMDSRLEDLKQCVSISPFEDVRFIGICGMGGLGKTTLARAYFEHMSCQFEASSFLANVREVCEKDKRKGLVELQKQLLKDILTEEDTINNVDQGQGKISTRLCHKRVLVILDDVDDLDQLEGLAKEKNWFGDGSRIILTTRDESLLRSMYGEEEYMMYKVAKLDYNEALHLFSSKAFKSDCPLEDYRELSGKVIKYADGLPLALVVLGSFLHGKNIDQWKSALDRLKEYPEKKIMRALRISFDGLEELEKKIFLDIACFFNGYGKDYIMNIMDCCGFHPEIGIKSLVDKSLLHIYEDNSYWNFEDCKSLRMHDLLEEMGKEIVREESRNEPGRRSRIWLWDDFYDVMSDETGTEEVEAIVLKRWESLENLNMRGFSKMKKLRLLVVYSKSDCQDLEHLSNKLQFLQWSGFPSSFQELKFWNNPMKLLNKLTSIDLSFSRNIRKLEVDFSLFPNLEKLNLRFCDLLESITVLTSPSLESFLKVLKLSGCSSLRNLSFLNTIVGNGLEELDLSNCGLRDGAFPDDFGNGLVSLKYLNLSYNELSCLPAGFNLLSKLRSLDLSDSKNLTSLGPELPDSLESVTVNNCKELRTFLDPLSQCNLRCSTILCVDCFKLVKRQDSERTAITSLARYLQNSPSPRERFDIVLPGDEIPSWFTHQCSDWFPIGLPLHPNWCTNNWMGFALSVCFPRPKRVSWQIEINLECCWEFEPVCSLPPHGGVYDPHLWILYLPRDKYFRTDWHNKLGSIIFSVKRDDGDYSYNPNINCGVRLVYEKDIEELNLTATHEPIEAYEFEGESSDGDEDEDEEESIDGDGDEDEPSDGDEDESIDGDRDEDESMDGDEDESIDLGLVG